MPGPVEVLPIARARARPGELSPALASHRCRQVEVARRQAATLAFEDGAFDAPCSSAGSTSSRM
jgi:hypothetical protein